MTENNDKDDGLPVVGWMNDVGGMTFRSDDPEGTGVMLTAYTTGELVFPSICTLYGGDSGRDGDGLSRSVLWGVVLLEPAPVGDPEWATMMDLPDAFGEPYHGGLCWSFLPTVMCPVDVLRGCDKDMAGCITQLFHCLLEHIERKGWKPPGMPVTETDRGCLGEFDS